MANLFVRKLSPTSGVAKTDSGLDLGYQAKQYFNGLEMTDQRVPPMQYFSKAVVAPSNASYNPTSENISGSGQYYLRVMSGIKPTQAQFDNIMLTAISNSGYSINKVKQALDALSDRNYLIEFPLPYQATVKIESAYPHDIVVNFQGDDTLANVITSGMVSWWYIYSDTTANYVGTYHSQYYPTTNPYMYYQNLGQFPYCIGDASDAYR